MDLLSGQAVLPEIPLGYINGSMEGSNHFLILTRCEFKHNVHAILASKRGGVAAVPDSCGEPGRFPDLDRERERQGRSR